MLLANPILPGCNPDPSICRRGDDYYLAVSSFEWFPSIPIYHSRDLKNWKLIAHGLNDSEWADLRRLPSAKGIWAPCLTWCETDKLFYLMFSIMNSMNARFFDVDNFVITAPEITGPWSEPVFIHSAGFDPSMLHDDDGRKYIVSLEWETRDDYHKPGEICLVEFDTLKLEIIGKPKRIWRGGTRRGCIEGPHLTKRNGWYYLMCAEGGTGYGHAVTMARSKNVWGPYEGDPENPILTSTGDFDEMGNDDSRKLNRYNPKSVLQKAGHGSYVDTPFGETFLVHHCGRPFLPELRCTLGRETCMQKMEWTEDGWLRLFGGGNIAKDQFEASSLKSIVPEPLPIISNFDDDKLPIHLYAPRIDPNTFCDHKARNGYLIIRGQESLSSLNRASLLARKLTSLYAEAITKLEFSPTVYQEYAGICIYYDNMDYVMLRKTFDEGMNSETLEILQVENEQRIEYSDARVKAPVGDVWLKLRVEGRETTFYYSSDGVEYHSIGPVFDTSIFSDEYCENGEFTGTFLGIFCVDALQHRKTADFDFFSYRVTK